MSKEFTIEGFRQKLIEWAIDKEVKYVTGDVYHMILLREPDVAEFIKSKGFDGNILADAVEQNLDRSVDSSGNSWVGNKHDVEGRQPEELKNLRNMIQLMKDAEQDQKLKTPDEEKDFLQLQIEKTALISKVLRFSDEHEKGMVAAITLAKLAGKAEPTALELYEHINKSSFIGGKPSIYSDVGLAGLYGSNGLMGKKGFWPNEKPEPVREKTIQHIPSILDGMSFQPGRHTFESPMFQEKPFSPKQLDFKSNTPILFDKEEPGKKLNRFLQRHPEEAEFLQNLITAAVNKGLDERLGPKHEVKQENKNGPNPI